MRWLWLIIAVALLSGCDDLTPEQTGNGKSEPRVAETFNTGPGVVVRSLAFEKENSHLWVGTSHGVLEIKLPTAEMVNVFTRDHGLANEYVFAIAIDSQGYKWFGTNAGGVSRYKDGQWKTLFPLHGLADYWVYAFAEQSPESFWIGTWAGVNQVDLADLSFQTYVKELINEWVYGIGVDRKGNVWFGTEGGVTRFDGTNWRHWTHEDGLGAVNAEGLPHSNNTGLGTRDRHDLNISVEGGESYNPGYVFSVLVDADDKVWFGTWGAGVSRFDGNNWHTFTTADGLAGNVVYSSLQDNQGGFWFGTNNGLSYFDGTNWQTLGVEEGLPDNHIYALTLDANGDIWAGTNGGVVRVALEQKESPH